MEKKLIISDWNSDLDAYNIPDTIISKIKAKYGLDFIYASDAKRSDLKRASMYMGNIPSINFLDKIPNLSWVHFGSSGIDKLPRRYIQERSLTITNIGDINVRPLAMFILGELISSTKKNFIKKSKIHSTSLTRKDFNKYFNFFMEPDELKIGILGYGKTSKVLTNYLNFIFSKKINILSSQELNNTQSISFFKKTQAKEFLKDLTHVVNLLPLNTETDSFFDNNLISHIDKPIYYINAGRAETHNDSDLYNAAVSGKIWGASIDVHGLPGGKISKKFSDLDNFFLTPHIAGWTNKFWFENERLIDQNIAYFVNNEFSRMKNALYIQGQLK